MSTRPVLEGGKTYSFQVSAHAFVCVHVCVCERVCWCWLNGEGWGSVACLFRVCIKMIAFADASVLLFHLCFWSFVFAWQVICKSTDAYQYDCGVSYSGSNPYTLVRPSCFGCGGCVGCVGLRWLWRWHFLTSTCLPMCIHVSVSVCVCAWVTALLPCTTGPSAAQRWALQR